MIDITEKTEKLQLGFNVDVIIKKILSFKSYLSLRVNVGQ